MKSIRQIIFLFVIYLHFAYSFIDLSYFKTFMSNLVEERRLRYENVHERKRPCDDHQLMLHLAEKHITSPEKILILLATDSLDESCRDISDTITKINKCQRGCIPLPSEDLYMKLFEATKFFNSSVCRNDSVFQKKRMDCLPDLYDEFLECEGPLDWYEKEDRIVRCSIFNDIIKCNHVKAAAFCGLEPGENIRSFAIELFQLVQPKESTCEVPRSLPGVSSASQARVLYSSLLIISMVHKQFYSFRSLLRTEIHIH